MASINEPSIADASTRSEGPDMLSAGSRVAGIFELLEMILLELSLKDILSSQATSKSFKSVVETSEPIRGKFGIPFSDKLDTHKWIRHPLLPKELDECKDLDIWTTRTSKGGVFTGRLFLRRGSEDKWSYPASWKGFPACRPSTRSMRASSGCSTVFGSTSTGHHRYYRSEKGITLGQLVDAACEMKDLAGVDEAIVHFDTEVRLDGSDVHSPYAAAGFIGHRFRF